MEKVDMHQSPKAIFIALLTILYAIIVLITGVLLIGTGSTAIASSIGEALLVLTPLLLGIVSISECARAGVAFGDRYSIMNTSSAFALCVLAIAEAAFLTLQNFNPNDIAKVVYYVVASIGLLPWMASAVSYLRQSNEVLEFFSNRNLKKSLVLCVVLCPMPVILTMSTMIENIGLAVIVTFYPLLAMTSLLLLTLGLISWIFRKGQLVKHILCAFLGVCLLAMHFAIQSVSSTVILLAFNLITGIEGYSLIGTSLLLAEATADRA
ncbi:MAG: hypothetical protein ACOC38_02350 [Promethearchaeia archaeon]